MKKSDDSGKSTWELFKMKELLQNRRLLIDRYGNATLEEQKHIRKWLKEIEKNLLKYEKQSFKSILSL